MASTFGSRDAWRMNSSTERGERVVGVVDEHVAVGDRREDVDAARRRRRSRAWVTGTHGSSFRSGRSSSCSAQSPPRSSGPACVIRVVVGDVELAQEQVEDLVA